MDYNKNIRSTWIMVIVITAFAYIISGLIELRSKNDIWWAVSKLITGSVLLFNGLTIKIKKGIIFKNVAPYFILFFLGYVLSLVGVMISFNASLWYPGILLLLSSAILAFIKKNNN
ncbi:hypothetical protein [Saccharicrinis sp. FJH54]|uniref:hypothetical protein n=1 Tax=Saccharicrinis sp. FJH54 TaxID=3344665 RepID=UPI0035D4E188